MCVICFTQNVDISNDYIKKLWDENPDGAGFAFIESKSSKMYFAKGFLDVNQLIEALPKVRENLVLHFRIATSGLVDANNCHPFNIDKVNEEEGYADRLLFHNGVTPITWSVKKKLLEKHSDTYLLCKDILSHVSNKKMYDVILSANSKYALYDTKLSKDRWWIYGKWEDSDGMMFSNLHFKIPTPYTGYGKYTGRSYIWDEFDNYLYGGGDNDVIKENLPLTTMEDIDADFDEEKDWVECEFCHVELHEDDIPFGVCADCTIDHGLLCDCKSRMIITNDGGYFCSSGVCN